MLGWFCIYLAMGSWMELEWICSEAIFQNIAVFAKLRDIGTSALADVSYLMANVEAKFYG